MKDGCGSNMLFGSTIPWQIYLPLSVPSLKFLRLRTDLKTLL